MTLRDAAPNVPCYIASVQDCDEAMQDFLFSLGCYPGEKITVISSLAGNVIISMKNARYSIDSKLARCISVEPREPVRPALALR